MNNRPKVVLILPKVMEDDLTDQLREACELQVLELFPGRDELLEIVRDVDAVIGNTRIKADSEFFDAAQNLRVLCTCSVGYDSIDIEEASRRGVLVCHTPGVLTDAVANLTMSMIFALALRLFPNAIHVRSGNWSAGKNAPDLGMDIHGKTLGVVGFGRIGQEVTRRMQALRMRTIWYDIFDTVPEGGPDSEYRKMDDLLEESDFVTLHSNLSESSRYLIGEPELKRMKPSAFLINTARGGLVDQAALVRALQTEEIAGAALDVFEKEPPDPNDPIIDLPNALCFPHIGSATEETRRTMRELTVENVLTALEGKMPPAPVNPEVLKR